jgi:hypothetical protein
MESETIDCEYGEPYLVKAEYNEKTGIVNAIFSRPIKSIKMLLKIKSEEK